jgi:MYXO-CTERM domain-containing protein
MISARTIAAALVPAVLFSAGAAAAKTKIACVGASTTSGDGSTAGHHYPDELQRLEGGAAEVKNFGVSGTTMLRAVSASYWNTPALGQALAYVPDVVIIWFGGNDAKPENWTAHKAEFLGDYEAMIHMFQALPSHPRTYVVLSLLTRDTEGIPKAVVDAEVIPLCRQAAAETGSGIVDVHDDLAAHPEYFPDGIHPDDMGTVAVAMLAYAAINAPADAGASDGAIADGPAVSADAAVTGSPPPMPPPSDASSAAGPQALDASGGGASGSGGAPPSGGASGSGGAPAFGGAPGAGGPPKVKAGAAAGGCDVAASQRGSFAVFLIALAALALARRRRAEISNPSGGPP